MEEETLPGLFRGSHSFSSTLDNGGAVAHKQLLVCYYHAADSHTLYLVNDIKGKGGGVEGGRIQVLLRPCLDQCTDGH